MVASCHGCPPWAIAMKPAFCTACASAMNSSQVLGSPFTPAFSRTALLAHTQLVECTFTGAAIHLPLYLENFCKPVGTTLSQPSFAASALRSDTTPCLAQSRMSNPSICTAVGGLPAVTRARSAVMACSPPPPATGMSFHFTPCFSRLPLSTLSAAASPPEVHQCSTSTLCWAAAGSANAVAMTRVRICFFIRCLLLVSEDPGELSYRLVRPLVSRLQLSASIERSALVAEAADTLRGVFGRGRQRAGDRFQGGRAVFAAGGVEQLLGQLD